METVVAPRFGLSLDTADRERMQHTARFHAKVPGELVFQQDSARKQRDADLELRELANRWIGPAYARLEEVRRAQSGLT